MQVIEQPHKIGTEEEDDCSLAFEKGLDFLLTHFKEPLFPRTITTAATKNKQFTICKKQDILNAVHRANFIDCRINAYPIYTDYKGINRQAPNIIFIDIDHNDFKSDAAHNQALQDTLANTRKQFRVQPTVLLSGNGYHIILPIDVPVLEQIDEFEKFERPSQKFLRYAEDTLSNGNADLCHTPSFKSCLLRIPGSLNKKCIEAGKRGKDTQVRIIQRWDGKRDRPSKQCMDDFYIYLTAERIKELQRTKEITRSPLNGASTGRSNHIQWIERLLNTPISDYRKHTVDLIIAPYLIIVRQLSHEEAYRIIELWLDKYNTARRLDFSPKDKIKAVLKNASKNKIPPMRIDTLKQRNQDLYKLIAKVSLHNKCIL